MSNQEPRIQLLQQQQQQQHSEAGVESSSAFAYCFNFTVGRNPPQTSGPILWAGIFLGPLFLQCK